ncbi:MAG: efflux RND transporter periplasmic adaptor subunit [Actinobacteria bacterium]|nr:efflux RND transporter periplasmic adaptor subunit [Actinomycetota bacterium]
MKKRLIVVPLMLILFATAGTGWYYYAGVQGSSNGKIEGSGTLEAMEVHIGSQLAAEVIAIKAKEGGKVKKGDTLVTLDDRVLKDQVLAAQAGVEVAQAALDDADTNAEKRAASAQLKQAEAALSIARIQQSYAVIKSPADGIVLSLPLREGEMVNPGFTLAVIGKVSSLELTIYVDEKELGKVKIGQGLVIKAGAFPGKKFTGRVTEIASGAEFTPQNVQTKEQRSNLVFGVTIKVDNADGLLKPGMPADAELR